uniref:Uncharacterized protein n=1 Tax=Geospiza parvula TaxID=87175 RepID=A0A8C3M7A5_GEOPR
METEPEPEAEPELHPEPGPAASASPPCQAAEDEDEDEDEDFQFLRCDGCGQDSAQPRLLRCLHTLCPGCLSDTKQCPRCQAATGAPAVDNLLFCNLRSRLQLWRQIRSSGGPGCSRCRAEAALVWCSDCEEFFCGRCLEEHQWWHKKKAHRVRRVEELRAGSARQFLEDTRGSCSLFCSSASHPEESRVCSIYCPRCERALCCPCALLDTRHAPFRDLRREPPAPGRAALPAPGPAAAPPLLRGGAGAAAGRGGAAGGAAGAAAGARPRQRRAAAGAGAERGRGAAGAAGGAAGARAERAGGRAARGRGHAAAAGGGREAGGEAGALRRRAGADGHAALRQGGAAGAAAAAAARAPSSASRPTSPSAGRGCGRWWSASRAGQMSPRSRWPWRTTWKRIQPIPNPTAPPPAWRRSMWRRCGPSIPSSLSGSPVGRSGRCPARRGAARCLPRS